MGIITKVLRAADSKADKLLKRILKGDPNSPYKEVDDLGSFPVARGVNEPAGVEKKKLKKLINFTNLKELIDMPHTKIYLKKLKK